MDTISWKLRPFLWKMREGPCWLLIPLGSSLQTMSQSLSPSTSSSFWPHLLSLKNYVPQASNETPNQNYKWGWRVWAQATERDTRGTATCRTKPSGPSWSSADPTHGLGQHKTLTGMQDKCQHCTGLCGPPLEPLEYLSFAKSWSYLPPYEIYLFCHLKIGRTIPSS